MPDAGFAFSTSQLFTLVAMPALIGATARFPYTFAVARFGGRNWTVVSGLVLIVSCLALVVLVTNPSAPYWAFLVAAGLAGLGGSNFASSMANISYFYPKGKKGLLPAARPQRCWRQSRREHRCSSSCPRSSSCR